MPDSSENRHLVLQLARLGDFLQTTPLLAALKEKGPVQVLTPPAQAPLAWASGLADEVHILDPDVLNMLMGQEGGPAAVRQAGVNAQLAPLKDLRPDVAINLNFTPLAALALASCQARRIRGWRFQESGEGASRLTGEEWMPFIFQLAAFRRLSRMHLSDILASYADPPGPPLPSLAHRVSAKAGTAGEALLAAAPARSVGLQLGANSPLRRWPLNNFAALSRALLAQGIGVVLVGSHREEDLAQRFLQQMEGSRDKIINLCGRTDLLSLGAVLKRLELVISGDTGTLHLASAVGSLCLALYMGPAQVHETGPYGAAHLTLQARHTCQPCTEENPFCKGQAPCRFFIKSDMVIRASLGLMRKTPLKQLAAQLGLGRQTEAYQGEFDRFGLTYQPLCMPLKMTREYALALSLREAGRALLRSSYRSEPERLQQEISQYYRKPESGLDLQELIDHYQNIADIGLRGPDGQATLAQAAGARASRNPHLAPALNPVLAVPEHPRIDRACAQAALTLKIIRDWQ
jgi:ADP-heptose:LPS heptosyltransferase